MLCQNCGERPATVHVTRVVNGEKTESHLCEVCAGSMSELGLMSASPFSIHNLLGSLMHSGHETVTPPRTVCPTCGMTYAEFARTSLLGCTDCYAAFQPQLDPLLRRIQGSVEHVGKTPHRTGAAANPRRELERLRQELQHAIEEEAFERAAELRDRIKELEQGGEAS